MKALRTRCVLPLLAVFGAYVPDADAAGTPPVRVGVSPVSVEGEEGAHIPKHFEQRTQSALSAEGIVLVPLPETRACKDEACFAASAAKADVAFVVGASAIKDGRDYSMKATLRDRDGKIVHDESAACEICTFGEAAERLGFEVASFRGRVLQAADAAAKAEPCPELDPRAAMPASAVDFGTQRGRVAAFSLIGLGVVGVGTAIPLIVLDEQNYSARCAEWNTDSDGDCQYRYATLEAGVATLAGGVVSAAIGSAILMRSRRQRSASRSDERSLATRVQVDLGPRQIQLRGSF